MIVLENFQGIKPMGLGATLSDYKTNIDSEIPNYHKNLKM